MLTHPQEAITPSGGEADARQPAVRTRSMLSRPEAEDIWKYVLFGALAAGAAVVVYQNLPDIIRYIKIRSM